MRQVATAAGVNAGWHTPFEEHDITSVDGDAFTVVAQDPSLSVQDDQQLSESGLVSTNSSTPFQLKNKRVSLAEPVGEMSRNCTS